jgi:hypothetical protein
MQELDERLEVLRRELQTINNEADDAQVRGVARLWCVVET